MFSVLVTAFELACASSPGDEWKPDKFCSYSQPDVHDTSLMSIQRKPDSNAPIAQSGMKMVPRCQCTEANSVPQEQATSCLYWSARIPWTRPDCNTPTAKEGMRMVPRRHQKCRDGLSLSMLDCEVEKDKRTEEDLIWPGYAARCQEPPCFQSWWPSVTAFEHACAAAP